MAFAAAKGVELEDADAFAKPGDEGPSRDCEPAEDLAEAFGAAFGANALDAGDFVFMEAGAETFLAAVGLEAVALEVVVRHVEACGPGIEALLFGCTAS